MWKTWMPRGLNWSAIRLSDVVFPPPGPPVRTIRKMRGSSLGPHSRGLLIKSKDMLDGYVVCNRILS